MRRLLLGMFDISLEIVVEHGLAQLARGVGAGHMPEAVVPEYDIASPAVGVDRGMGVEFEPYLIVLCVYLVA